MTRRLKVLMTCELPEVFREPMEGVDCIATSDRTTMLKEIPVAEVACVGAWDAELLRAAGSLRWVHALTGGVSGFLFPEMRQHPALFTCCKGTFDITGAEHGLALMLLFARRLHEDLRRAPAQTPEPYDVLSQSELHGKTLGILGLGGMGTALAGRAKSFGMRVIASRRSAAPPTTEVDQLLPADQPHELLRQSDFVAVAVPLTPETEGLIGAEELRAMKSTAFLIDLSGRDALFDLDAIAQALSEGRIAGAAIQLLTPPAVDSPLWDLPNFIYSYHRVVSREQCDRELQQFRENLRRYRAGEPLLGIVDKELGY